MSNRDNFFKPGSAAAKLSNATEKAQVDRTAKGMISAEVAARQEKTEHLRRLRQERENEAAVLKSTKD